MQKFLKVYFKTNTIISLILLIYTAIAFIASAINIEFLLNYIQIVQSFSTFGVFNLTMTTAFLLPFITLVGFFINQYFNKIYLALYNFDKFREITGLSVILIFSSFQLIANFVLFGFFALIPFVLNCLSVILLSNYQKRNKVAYTETIKTFPNLEDPSMQEMSLKIGQLRILKSEGKITEEEFMFHLNNILENKE